MGELEARASSTWFRRLTTFSTSCQCHLQAEREKNRSVLQRHQHSEAKRSCAAGGSDDSYDRHPKTNDAITQTQAGLAKNALICFHRWSNIFNKAATAMSVWISCCLVSANIPHLRGWSQQENKARRPNMSKKMKLSRKFSLPSTICFFHFASWNARL